MRRSSSLTLLGWNELAEIYCASYERDGMPAPTGVHVDAAWVDQLEACPLPVGVLSAQEEPAAALCVVGYTNLLQGRASMLDRARALGYELVSWVQANADVHPRASVGDAIIALDGATIQPLARLGDGVVVWSGAVVCHHARLGDHCYVAPNATISGSTQLGDRVFVGSGAVVRDGVRIGDSAVIGAGAVVTRDVPAGAVVRAARSAVELDGAERLEGI